MSDVSGAQWSPERLRELADEMGRSTYEACDWTEAHAALRAFARVVSVLERVSEAGDTLDVHGPFAGKAEVTYERDDDEQPVISKSARGDTALAAILALADALDAGRGDDV